MERTTIIKPPVVLTIAGTDPSGGAGIQADLKTFTSLHCYGASVVTALTAQNTLGVQDVYAPPPEFVAKQLQSVLTDIEVNAVKTGMLFNAAVCQTVVDTLKQHYFDGNYPPIVVDPVCVSTSGHTLLEAQALSVLRTQLLPIATLVTPNKSEAELLLEDVGSISTISDMLHAAKRLANLGPKAVLLKGGHISTTSEEISSFLTSNHQVSGANTDSLHTLILAEGLGKSTGDLQIRHSASNATQCVVDILCQHENSDSYTYTFFVRPRIETTSTHGTGCTLAAALACELARGRPIKCAVEKATKYTHRAIVTAYSFGKGHGPLNHLHATLPRLLVQPTLFNPYPFVDAMISSTSDMWRNYVQHPFVKALGAGTLAKQSFVGFIKQDYHYLKYYARAQALIATKTSSLTTIASRAKIMLSVVHETASHTEFCASYGVSTEELELMPEEPETTAYGSYLIDIGMQGDETILLVAVSACLLGYGEVGLWLVKQAQEKESGFTLEGNPYRRWIDEYSGEKYQEAVQIGMNAIEDLIARDPPSPKRFELMCKVWERTVRLEIGFWNMALRFQ